MNLNLNKPVVFFDLEATGLNISQDKIVEISMLKISPDHNETSYTQRFNPEIPISDEVIAIHGITNEDVKDSPVFAEKAEEIKNFIGDADLAGYNSNRFDIPLLLEELLNAKVELEMENRRFVDVQTIFHKKEQRTLEAAYRFYCDKTMENAHSAEADTRATYEVLKSQLDKYNDLENDMNFLFDYTQTGKNKKIDFVGRLALNEKEQIIYNFGKHTGKTVEEVYRKEPGYHRWMLDNDFPLFTKQILKKETDRIIQNDRERKAKNKEKEAERFTNKLDQLKDKFQS